MPLQVPSKDAFCRELSQALQTEEQQRQQQAGRGAHGLTLSKIAHSLAEPVKVHLGGRKAFSGRPAARRLTQDSSPLPGQPPPPYSIAGACAGACQLRRAVHKSTFYQRELCGQPSSIMPETYFRRIHRLKRTILQIYLY